MSILQESESAPYVAIEARRRDVAHPVSRDNTGHQSIEAKRVLDLLGASLIFVCSAPIMLLIFLLLSFAGSPIYMHRRVGQHGRLFSCYKFRTMRRDADRALIDYLRSNPEAREEWDRNFKLTDDPRITWFGHFLRRTSLDELPQLFNVLKGDMSLVGPRPIVVEEVALYASRIRAYYLCRPGLTGLWQISGRNLVAYDRRVLLDAYYARKRSTMLDLKILLKTIVVVLIGHGAS